MSFILCKSVCVCVLCTAFMHSIIHLRRQELYACGCICLQWKRKRTMALYWWRCSAVWSEIWRKSYGSIDKCPCRGPAVRVCAPYAALSPPNLYRIPHDGQRFFVGASEFISAPALFHILCLFFSYFSSCIRSMGACNVSGRNSRKFCRNPIIHFLQHFSPYFNIVFLMTKKNVNANG